MRKAMAFVFGAIIGGIAGAVAALLITPYSGDELKTAIQKEVNNISIEIKEAALKKRAELEEQLEGMINPPESA